MKFKIDYNIPAANRFVKKFGYTDLENVYCIQV